jgi:hypothetical protein
MSSLLILTQLDFDPVGSYSRPDILYESFGLFLGSVANLT